MSALEYLQQINFCPKCGTEYLPENKDATGSLKCFNCGFRNYVKSFPTASAVIPNLDKPGEILLARRAFEPGKGSLENPGGFLNYGESPEAAILRELKEELGVEAEIEQVLNIGSEIYEQGGTFYPTTGPCFLVKPISINSVKLDLSENQEIVSVPLADILAGKVKFFWNSTKQAIENYANLSYHHPNE